MQQADEQATHKNALSRLFTLQPPDAKHLQNLQEQIAFYFCHRKYAAVTSVCNRHHRLDQQLCRWLLLTMDRLTGPNLVITQK